MCFPLRTSCAFPLRTSRASAGLQALFLIIALASLGQDFKTLTPDLVSPFHSRASAPDRLQPRADFGFLRAIA